MKKWLLVIIFTLTVVYSSAQAENQIAIVNIDSLFQIIAQKRGISEKLASEFKNRAIELQKMEIDLQNRMQHLQSEGSSMKSSERNKLEKDVVFYRKIFSQKAQIFKQDHQIRSNEERKTIISLIENAIKKVSVNKNIDLIFDVNTVFFHSKNIQDITIDVLKQVK